MIQMSSDVTAYIAGKMCYGFKAMNFKKEKVDKFINARQKEEHYSLGRHAVITFLVRCSRNCSLQLLRHAHLHCHQRSQRYCDEKEARYVTPLTILKHPLINKYNDFMKHSQEFYKEMVDAGIPKEDARFVLPSAYETMLIMSGNYQAWMDFLNLRLSTHAQWEIRNIAIDVGEDLIKNSIYFNGVRSTIDQLKLDLLKKGA